MPYPQFGLDFEVTACEADQFATEMAGSYAERMDVDIGYVAASIREVRAIHLGQAAGDKAVVSQADIRAGRTTDRERGLVPAVIEVIVEWFGASEPNQKVVFIERGGSQMMGYDHVGDGWSELD